MKLAVAGIDGIEKRITSIREADPDLDAYDGILHLQLLRGKYPSKAAKSAYCVTGTLCS